MGKTKFDYMVDDMVVGSPNINRMRQEVELVTSTALSQITEREVRSLVPKNYDTKTSIPVTRELENENSKWTLVIEPLSWGSYSLEVNAECRLKQTTGIELVYSTKRSAVTFDMKNVACVRASLGAFLELATSSFPALLGRIQPLLDAAR